MTGEQWDDFVTRLKHHNTGDGVNQHYTANPIFLVQKRVRIWGMETEYADSTKWVDRSGGEHEVYDTLADYYDELDEDIAQALDQYTETETCGSYQKFKELDEYDQMLFLGNKGHEVEQEGYVDRWEYVNAHFTKEGAEAFIKRKRHDYPDGLRVYVDSEYQCSEFNAVIEAILNGQVIFK